MGKIKNLIFGMFRLSRKYFRTLPKTRLEHSGFLTYRHQYTAKPYNEIQYN